MKNILVILAIVTSGFVYGQEPKDSTPPAKPYRKVKILHADPKLIALILANKTTFLTPPEMSVVEKTKKN